MLHKQFGYSEILVTCLSLILERSLLLSLLSVYALYHFKHTIGHTSAERWCLHHSTLSLPSKYRLMFAFVLFSHRNIFIRIRDRIVRYWISWLEQKESEFSSIVVMLCSLLSLYFVFISVFDTFFCRNFVIVVPLLLLQQLTSFVVNAQSDLKFAGLSSWNLGS